jgi:hypothetical protein
MRGISPISDAPPRQAPSPASGGRRRPPPALGYAALAAIVGISLIVAALAAAQPSSLVPPSRGGFPRWLAGPLAGLLPAARPGDTSVARDASIALGALAVAYVAVLATASRLRTRPCVAAIVLVHVVFLLTPPLQLTDLFNYLVYARMDVLHGLSPYAHVPAHVAHDPAYPYATWHRLSSPYGPLFTLASLPLALLPVPVAYWALKLLIVAASLGCLRLVWVAARELRRPPLPAVLFVALNPLVVFFALGGVHNDFLMVGLLVAGVALLSMRREGAATGAVVAAVAVKLPALIALPFALNAARRKRTALAGGWGGSCR